MKITLPAHSEMCSPSFIYGVATASFQIEGAADSRLPCIWDTFCQQPGKIRDNSNGLVACDHFSRWQDDIGLIASLNVDAYRFSVSWPRVMHQDGTPNQQGLDFYIRLLDALKANNIKAFVTLYHWDLPQYLEDQGGWLNRETVYRFRDYVDLVTRAFGDRVYSYATLNEPFCSGYLGYETGFHAPGRQGRAFGRQAVHHLLLAHGLAMQVLRNNSPHSENGIVLNFSPCYPASSNDEDINAARLADDYHNHWYIKPLLEGRYPDLLHSLADADKPVITDGDMEIIAQPVDWIGINYYTRALYQAGSSYGFETAPTVLEPLTAMGWEVYPQGLTDILQQMHNRYPQLPAIYITENGAAMPDNEPRQELVDDPRRVSYFQQHLLAVHNAMQAGVNIKGYFAWSLLDNFEWTEGYAKRFGIVYVDYQTQQRTLKSSAVALSRFFTERHNK
ncbi:GH1 family beta-glucosidase [Chromatiaceae bacterium AAb-1]|nr:GH1 family beta-glucosidase [Chromatiaceae bacterium AAb-1]